MLKALLIGFLVIVNFPSFAQETDDPYKEVERVTSSLFERLKLVEADKEGQAGVIKGIVREELIPFTDHQFAAFKVLGSHFRSIPKGKLGEYIDVFQEYLVVNYASVLSSYTNQTLQFQSAGDFQNKKQVTVRAVIIGGQGPDINIAFKVRKNRKTSHWQVYDIVAEGISMVSSKQSQYASVIRQNGIDAVIAQMNAAINADALIAMQGNEQNR